MSRSTGWLHGLAMSALVLVAGPARAQQIADTTYAPPIEHPAFAAGSGPVVAIDQAHHNFHTLDGRYRPFADLLRRDGFRLRALAEPFTPASLSGIDLLVIANALNVRNAEPDGSWDLPTPPAFTSDEVDAVREWVRDGGALFLIVDHMPMPGAAMPLAAAFGVQFRNGFAHVDSTDGAIVFRRGTGPGKGESGGWLADHPITDDLFGAGRIDSVVSFTGSPFDPGPYGEAILRLPVDTNSLEPTTAWQFDATTRKVPVGGWSQGAVLRYGRGRVAVWGEAAMFSAQLGGPQMVPIGMNSRRAPQNYRLLLSLTRWLAAVPSRERHP